MYNQPYFIPGYFNSMSPAMMRGAMGSGLGRAMGGMGSAMNGARLATQGASAGRGLGLFSRLSNSMRAIKGINWGGLINNASKTLNVVNQAIPLVRQVGPMVSNVKSMLRVASIFKDETDKVPSTRNSSSNSYQNISNNTNSTSNNASSLSSNNNTNTSREQYSFDDNSPTFFVNS